jgi:4-hydroxyphenylpyruvate dioxygenase
MNKHLIQHGDGVRDIAFTVDDATAIYDYSIKNGANSIHPPTKI